MLVYAPLALSAFFCLTGSHAILISLALLTAIGCALATHVLYWNGLLFLSFFFFCAFAYAQLSTHKHWVRGGVFLMLLIGIAGISLHIIPGFSNILALDQVQFSEAARPFSLYLNFDKISIAFILLITQGMLQKQEKFSRSHLWTTVFFYVACTLFILGPSLFSGYVHFDFTFPHTQAAGLWALNNLLFVSLGEEILFRGFVQKELKVWCSQRYTNLYVHVILASLFFAVIPHWHGGPLYIALAFCCGLFYGLTYEKTQNLLAPTLVHFGLNLTHFIFFTYPSAAPSMH